MIAPDSPRLPAALKRLSSDSDFRIVLDWIETTIAEQRRINDYQTSDSLLRQGQGRVQVLIELVDRIKTGINR